MRNHNFFLVLLLLILWSCGNSPNKIEPSNDISSESIFNGPSQSTSNRAADVSAEVIGDVNKVQVLDFLPTQKYMYMQVKNLDTDEEYWIATTKMAVAKGDVFFYKEALLKEDFHSREHDKHFDRIYLVDNIVPANHGGGTGEPTSVNLHPLDQIEPMEGSIPIATIVGSPSKYANTEVQVSGVCTKVNNNIMDRNWIHLKDQSGSDFDFVATTDQTIEVGQQVTLIGTISTDKDFGAGYQYEIILENCSVVQ